MTTSNTERLLAVVTNEALPTMERRTAAELFVAEEIATIPAPADDEPEVVKLTRGWEDKRLAELMADATNGRSLTGHTLADARDSVARRRKRKMLEQLHQEHESQFVRDAAGVLMGKPYPGRRTTQ